MMRFSGGYIKPNIAKLLKTLPLCEAVKHIEEIGVAGYSTFIVLPGTLGTKWVKNPNFCVISPKATCSISVL